MAVGTPTREPVGAGSAVPAGAGGDGRRPHLDGLRTVAVYLVVAFHAGASRAAGGFIGVDVFFVLSGYLVTGVLVRDLRSTGGIRFGRFYARRFRRLLPASFVTLVVTALVFSAVASPAEVSEAMRSIRAAFMYVANWFFIGEANDYFADEITASPVVHFWSLAIEEQFYLLWPILLGGLFWATRRAGAVRWHLIRAIIAVGGLCSLAAALWIGRTNLSRAYYGTDTRAYQLLAGALLAVTPWVIAEMRRRPVPARIAALASLVGLVLLATSLVDTNAINRGVMVTVITCLLIAGIESGDGGIVQRGLSTAPMVYLGQISYGTYLWHWPIIVVAVHLVEISPISLFALSALLATGLAAVSYELLERPVRETPVLNRARWSVVAVGLTASVVGGFVVAPRLLEGGERRALAGGVDAQIGTALVPADFDWEAAFEDRPASPSCLGEAATECTMVTGEGPQILLMGDSHAAMFVPAFEKLARDRGASLSVAIRASCPWQEDLYFGTDEKCEQTKRDSIHRVVPHLDPDVIVLAGQSVGDPVSPLGYATPSGRIEPGEASFLPRARAATEETLRDLEAEGRRIVIVEPIPRAAPEEDPLKCLSGATYVDECRYVASPGPLPMETMYRSIAEADDAVWSFDADRLACPYLPICDPMIDGVAVKHDSGHLTGTYAATLSDEFAAYLEDEGIIEPG